MLLYYGHYKGEKKREATPPPRLPSPPTPHDGSYTETFDSASRTDNQAQSLRDEPRTAAGKPGKTQQPGAVN